MNLFIGDGGFDLEHNKSNPNASVGQCQDKEPISDLTKERFLQTLVPPPDPPWLTNIGDLFFLISLYYHKMLISQ